MIPDDLRVAGFLDARRALSFLEELPAGQSWVGDLSASADPDQALLQAVRLREADPGLVDALSRDERARRRVCAILGGSQWLGDYVIADPARAAAINEDPGDPREVLYEAALSGAVCGWPRGKPPPTTCAPPTGACCYIWPPTT